MSVSVLSRTPVKNATKVIGSEGASLVGTDADRAPAKLESVLVLAPIEATAAMTMVAPAGVF
jgi:hypothetical protein